MGINNMQAGFFSAGKRMQWIKQFKARLGIKNVTMELAAVYAYKQIYQNLLIKRPDHQAILPIMGCQRSGTSLMTRVFERDINAKVYRESSKLSSRDSEKLRLNSFAETRDAIQRHKPSLIVMKPLVESQNALHFMEVMPNSFVLWMYRHYRDVISSYLKAFGLNSGIRDLRIIVNREANNWRSEHVTDETRNIILNAFSEDMNPYDAMALFWIARNRLFFEQSLQHHPRVLLCWYDDFVLQPEKTMCQIYEFVKLPYPGDQIVQEIRTSSVGKGQEVLLSPEIEQMCDQMLQKLRGVEVVK
jgi:hypothetical protein